MKRTSAPIRFAEEALREAHAQIARSEERWRSVFENSAIGVALADLNGRILATNPVYQKMLGYSEEELQQLGILDITVEEDRDRNWTLIEELLGGKRRQFQIEKRYRHKDGSLVWVRNNVSLVPGTERVPRFFMALSEDITERKQAEEALRESEQSFRLIVDGIAGLVAIMTAGGEVETVNRQALEYFGKTAEELKFWPMTDAVHPDDLPQVISAWGHSIETISPYDADHRLRRADGAYRWFHAHGLPQRDDDGRAVRWYVLLTDIHERKQAEEKLRRSEADLLEAQRLTQTCSWKHDLASGRVSVSPEALRMFGVNSDEDTSDAQFWFGRIHPEHRMRTQSLFEKCETEKTSFEADYRVVLPDGSVRYQHSVGRPVLDRSGDLVEFVGTAMDVTERVQAEEALNRARSELARAARTASLGALTASIAHEVNQPLSGIITNAGTCLRMLSADPPNVEGARETARRTIRDGNRAAEVITRLRALYARKDIAPGPMDLNEATQEVISLSLSDLQRNGVILRTELGDELPLVTGDRVQLQQVVMNLLRNASDSMSTVVDRPRELLVRTERDDGDRVRLSVKDAGVGFDAEAADRLFQPFYTTKNDGMGIGLSISRSIIEGHHGRLWAARNDGPGATFSFSIPRKPEAATAASSARASGA